MHNISCLISFTKVSLCYKVRSYSYNPLRNGACEKQDQLRRLATFLVNKARTHKPTYTTFEFSLHYTTYQFSLVQNQKYRVLSEN